MQQNCKGIGGSLIPLPHNHNVSSASKILLLYTGGTVGMIQEKEDEPLKPMNFERLLEYFPELQKFDFQLKAISFEKPIDSSDVQPGHWINIAEIIADHYASVDGFVVLHGSDTMSFTASALSFMFSNLAKPVVFTGSQLPAGVLRTDAKENLITALQIAASKDANGLPTVPEVSLYFEYQLYRANRSHKFNAHGFKAFLSTNYPILAEAGVSIRFNTNFILPKPEGEFHCNTQLNTNLWVLYVFPGIDFSNYVHMLTTSPPAGMVLLTFGTGNAPHSASLENLLHQAQLKGIPVMNVTQCREGSVVQGLYETSNAFVQYEVVSGQDITPEAAITKMMHVLGTTDDYQQIKLQLSTPLRGEMSLP